MADEAEAVRKFRDVTDVDEAQAKECLRAANNNVEAAINRFFGGQAGNVEEEDDDDIEELPAPPTVPRPTGGSASDNRFKTVSSLAQDSSSDEEEGGQAFYAGGSTHSGQQVLGPGRSRSQIVADMFRSVREHGGETVEQEVGGPRKPNTVKFAGTGYRLGQTSDDTEVIKSGNSSGKGQQQVSIALKMWRQGFSINDGPLRDYSNPENMQFLKTVSRGIIPDELIQQARGSEVHLNMEDHSSEEYVQTKPKVQAFMGKGNVLGSPVPGIAPTQPVATSSEDRGALEVRAREAVPLDPAAPVTSVQIRLTDGSRLVASFNHSHTLADIRTFINTARPEYSSTSYRLLTTYPSKELTDDSSTITEAGILNAALLQRLS